MPRPSHVRAWADRGASPRNTGWSIDDPIRTRSPTRPSWPATNGRYSPLLRDRKLFAEVDRFCIFDFQTEGGKVDENVFALLQRDEVGQVPWCSSTTTGRGRGGRIGLSAPFVEKCGPGPGALKRKNLAEALEFDASPGHYLTAKELRSGLWHVFDCRDPRHKRLEGLRSKASRPSCSRISPRCSTWMGPTGGSANPSKAGPSLTWTTPSRRLGGLSSTTPSSSPSEPWTSSRRPSPAARDKMWPAWRKKAGTETELFFSWLSQALSEDEGPRPGISSVEESGRALRKGLAALVALAGLEGEGSSGARRRGVRDLEGRRSAARCGVAGPWASRPCWPRAPGAKALVRYLFLLALAFLVPRREQVRGTQVYPRKIPDKEEIIPSPDRRPRLRLRVEAQGQLARPRRRDEFPGPVAQELGEGKGRGARPLGRRRTRRPGPSWASTPGKERSTSTPNASKPCSSSGHVSPSSRKR